MFYYLRFGIWDLREALWVKHYGSGLSEIQKQVQHDKFEGKYTRNPSRVPNS